MADLPLLGCCPLCHTIVPLTFDDQHGQWHASRGEPAPSLGPLPDDT